MGELGLYGLSSETGVGHPRQSTVGSNCSNPSSIDSQAKCGQCQHKKSTPVKTLGTHALEKQMRARPGWFPLIS